MRGKSRLGRFKVSGEFMDGLRDGEGANLLAGTCVLDVRHDFIARTSEFVAWNPAFRPVAQGEVIPLYDATFTSTSSTPTWKEVPGG